MTYFLLYRYKSSRRSANVIDGNSDLAQISMQAIFPNFIIRQKKRIPLLERNRN